MAIRFLEAAEATFAKLVENPKMAGFWDTASTKHPTMRVWPVQGFGNHLIFYEEAEGIIEIVRFLHAARDIDRLM